MNQKNSVKNSSETTRKPSNFSLFIGPKYATTQYIPYPDIFLDLGDAEVLNDAQFAAAIRLYRFCYKKSLTTFSKSLPELALIMKCSRKRAYEVTMLLRMNGVLDSSHERGGKNTYFWNVDLWISGEGVVSNRNGGSFNLKLGEFQKETGVVSNRNSHLYTLEFLLEFIFRISLKNVYDAWSQRVDNFPEILERGENDRLSSVEFLYQKGADWRSAVELVGREHGYYLVILFFKHKRFVPTDIGSPTDYLVSIFNDGKTKHELLKLENFLFENDEEFFSFYGSEMSEQLNAGGYQ